MNHSPPVEPSSVSKLVQERVEDTQIEYTLIFRGQLDIPGQEADCTAVKV